MPDEKQFRLNPYIIYGLILLVIIGIALFLRIYLRLGDVFGAGWVRFGETDPWYHVRLIENLMHHFPQRISFDPYTFFPYGREVFFAPLYDLIIGFVVWIAGLGSPSQHLLEVIAAYFPAVLGALVVIPVFFIGKELFNRKVGLICGALIAVLPGDFFARSLLGLTDHHVAEVLFSTVAALFLILAVKSAREKEISFSDVRDGKWAKLRRPLIYTLLFGLVMGIYMLSWVGGLLFVLIIFVYIVVQYIIDHLKGRSTGYLCIIGVPSFIIALLLVMPFTNQGSLVTLDVAAPAIAAIIFIILAALSWFMESRKVKRAFYLPGILVIGVAALLMFSFIAHSMFSSMLNYFNIFLPQGGSLTITEVQPLFMGFQFPYFTHSRAWGFFTTGFFIVPISLVIMVYSLVKEARAERIFFVTWSVLMLAAMIGQNRFSYYFAVNVALFGGYFLGLILEWVGRIFDLIKIKENQPERIAPKKKKKKIRKQGEPVTIRTRKLVPGYVSVTVGIVIGFFLLFYPNIRTAVEVERGVPAPDNDWHDSLVWMRDNTPDPFSDPGEYYALYQRPAPGQQYVYPKSAYGVMSWWDYGHWITGIAHRIPNSNAFQDGATDAARFFTAQNEASAENILDALGSRYIIIDIEMATSKFPAMADWAGISPMAGYYYQRNSSGKLERVLIYYPEYYKSMCSRLYNFGGEAVVPSNSSLVIAYENKIDSRGTPYKEITSSKMFPTYKEAEAFVQKSPGYQIVGTDPSTSPVPLEKLNHFQLVHQSDSIVEQEGDRKVTYVEIFEYKP
jgi:oligosaccharyl transferase (archaeosortase A-associated)